MIIFLPAAVECVCGAVRCGLCHGSRTVPYAVFVCLCVRYDAQCVCEAVTDRVGGSTIPFRAVPIRRFHAPGSAKRTVPFRFRHSPDSASRSSVYSTWPVALNK